jgi:hypothetical protein
MQRDKEKEMKKLITRWDLRDGENQARKHAYREAY